LHFPSIMALAMLAPGVAHGAHATIPQIQALPAPATFNVAANNHIQTMRFLAHDAIGITSDLSGSLTGLDLNDGMAFAPDGSLWSANVGVLNHPPALEHFAKGATGNSAPLATITCGLSEPTNVAVDAAGNVYALNRLSETVAVFAPTQNGCATPIAVIGGSKTGLSQGMTAINVDAAGRIYVGSFQNAEVVVFAPGANGNVAPIGVLKRGVSGVSSIAFDKQQNVYVANVDLGSIEIYAPGKFGVNVAPIRQIDGSLAARPSSIAITPDQRLFTLNFISTLHEVFEYPAGAGGSVQPVAIWDSVVNPALGFVNNLITPFR